MEIYNKAYPYDIMNVNKFSKEEFNRSNLITMVLNSFNKQKFYKLAICLKNIVLCEYTQNKIKLVLQTQHLTNEEIIIENNYISFTTDITNYSQGDFELNYLIQNIFKILFEDNYIDEQTFFAISYNYLDEIYSGYINTIDILI